MPLMPTVARDERDQLLLFLNQQRAAVKNAAYGLTDAQAAATPTTSPLSVGGLIKHLTFAERGWLQDVLGETAPAQETTEEEYLDGFRMLDGERIADLLADYERACAETDATLRSIEDMDQEVPVPEGRPWLPTDISAWTVRWVVLHLIEETARHAGHADVIREAIDGGVAATLMAAAEGWPADGWVTPWTPTESAPGLVPA